MTTSPTPQHADVVLPCLNEADALPWVLARIPAGWRARVVDNGAVAATAPHSRFAAELARLARLRAVGGR